MHVVVNAAMSADGKLSTRRREQVAISNPTDFARVEELRAECDAIAVGVGTVLADDPHLTVDDAELQAERESRGESAHLARVVADSRGRTPTEARVLDDVAETYVLVSDAAPVERRRALAAAGAEVIVAGDSGTGASDAAGATDADVRAAASDGADAAGSGATDHERVDLAAALDDLESRGIEQLLVEGGGELLFSLFEAGLVDELRTFVGPTVIGGRDAPTLVDGAGFVDEFVDLELTAVERLDGVLASEGSEGQESESTGVLLEWTVEE